MKTLIGIRKCPYTDSMVSLFDQGKKDSLGKHVLAYTLTHNDKVIFEGDDFSPSPCHKPNSHESFGSLLGFLSLQKGDTDDEYFENYTKLQLIYSEMYGEELKLFVCDLEEGIYDTV